MRRALEQRHDCEVLTHESAPRVSYSIEEACTRTGLGRTTLYAAIKQRQLRARKCGTRTIILAEDLLKFLNNLPDAGSP